MLICRRLLPAGLDLLTEAGCEIREGGLDATPDELRRSPPAATRSSPTRACRSGAELLDAAGPGLRVVANFAVGYDNVDLDACRERGVAVTNTPDVLTNATAELALALTVAAARRTSEAEAELRAGRWTGWDPEDFLGLELSGATFGIVGLGPDRHALRGARHAARRRAALHGPLGQARGRARAGREPRRARRAARALGRRQPACPGERRDAPPDRRGRARGDEAATPCSSTPRAGRSSTRRRSPGRSRTARSAPRASTSTRTSPTCRPSCSPPRAASSSPTSGRRRERRATEWPTLAARNVLAVLAGDEPPNRVA